MPCDLFGRKIDYLRLSVTDACNLRCSYCMPLEQGVARQDYLTFEEIDRLVRILATIGIRRVRLTGGEPLVRRDLPRLIGMLNAIPGIEEVLLTTNGVLLKPLARQLKEGGLEKINIHLDTLSPEKFRKITRWGEIGQVFAGLEEAARVGLSPIKLNAVIQKGVNDDEVEGLLKFAAERGLILRLIELMPIGPAKNQSDRFITAQEIQDRLAAKFTLTPSTRRPGNGPACYYDVAVKELGALVGFISPVSRPFCESCNRIRISADGRFQDCLAYDGEVSLRTLLRDPFETDETIAKRVVALFQGKREGHNNFQQDEALRTPCMYGIGG